MKEDPLKVSKSPFKKNFAHQKSSELCNLDLHIKVLILIFSSHPYYKLRGNMIFWEIMIYHFLPQCNIFSIPIPFTLSSTDFSRKKNIYEMLETRVCAKNKNSNRNVSNRNCKNPNFFAEKNFFEGCFSYF